MTEDHSKLYYFFLADECRITINFLVFIGFILFIIVLYKAFNKKKLNFNLLFIVMINVMVCALLSIIGYIFNWKIKDEHGDRVLLFGKALCKTQSFFLNYFQTTRESLLTYLTIVVFLKYKKYEVETIKYIILMILFCYGIPSISNIISFIFDGFTENDLFCFTKVEGFGKTFGKIHYIYLSILTLINLTLVISIFLMDCKEGKKLENWLDDDSSNIADELEDSANFENNREEIEKTKFSKCCKCIYIDPLLKKIIPYPIAQAIALTFPIIYRVGNKAGNSVKWAKTAAIGNSSSAVLYTLIFFYFNKMVLDKENKDNKKNNINVNKEMEKLIN